MLVVNKKDVTFNPATFSAGAEASSLGLAPGEWPQFVSIVNDKGDGFLLGPGVAFYHNEEFGGMEYQSPHSRLKLDIYND